MKYPLFLKKIIHNTKYGIVKSIYKEHLQLDWVKSLNNFGDILNPIIVSNLSKKKIINVRSKYCRSEHLLAIGSILDRATNKSVVWGSGFISKDSTFIDQPKKIHAVRGPLTRELLLKMGVDCPEVYGDPALLLPLFYNPKIKKIYKLGILPHYVDKNSEWLDSLSSDIKIINVQNKDPLAVVSEMCECENIASSSLHGLIIADAYNIPSAWIQLSKKVFGGGFKFLDYFKSIGSEIQQPLVISSEEKAEDLIVECKLRPLDIDLDLLLESFPINFK